MSALLKLRICDNGQLEIYYTEYERLDTYIKLWVCFVTTLVSTNTRVHLHESGYATPMALGKYRRRVMLQAVFAVQKRKQEQTRNIDNNSDMFSLDQALTNCRLLLLGAKV